MQIITQTSRLCLRQWTESDKQPFAVMNRDKRVMKFLGPALSREASDATIARQVDLISAGEPAFWAVERLQDNLFIGCIGVKRVTFEANFTPCYEIGWRLGPSYWWHFHRSGQYCFTIGHAAYRNGPCNGRKFRASKFGER